MRRPAAALALVALVLVAAPSGAATGTSGSYAVHVLPDPTEPAGLYGHCGSIDGAVLAQRIGQDFHRLRVPAAGTLTVQVVPQLNVFAGDVGLNWVVKLYDSRSRQLARSRESGWRSEATHRFARAESIAIVVCNVHGHPDATVSYRFTPR